MEMRLILLLCVRSILANYLPDLVTFHDDLPTPNVTADAFLVFAKRNEQAILSCQVITSEHLTNFAWLKAGNKENEENVDDSRTNFRWKNETHGTMVLRLTNVTTEDYGDYRCTAKRFDLTTYDLVKFREYPFDWIFTVRVLEPESIRMNWKFNEHYAYSRSSLFRIEYRKSGTDQWQQTPPFSIAERIDRAGSFVINTLEPSTVYEVKGVVSTYDNRHVRRTAFSKWVTTPVSRKMIPEADRVTSNLNKRSVKYENAGNGWRQIVQQKGKKFVYKKSSKNHPKKPTRMSGSITPEVNYVFARLNEPAVLSCDVMGNQMTNFTWVYKNKTKNSTNVWWKDIGHVTFEIELASVTARDDGKYKCMARSSDQLLSATSQLRLDKFDIVPLKVQVIGTDRIYVIWNHTNIVQRNGDYDKTCVRVALKYKEIGTNQWHRAGKTFYSYVDRVTGHYVISNLKNRTRYHIKTVVYKCELDCIKVMNSYVLSKWATTFEKDVEYVPSVEIVNKTMDTVTIKWSQPPPELREYIDAYVISVENGNEKEKHFRWQKYKAKDRDKAVLYLSRSIIYDLVVRACIDDDCPDRHASVVMKGVMTNDTAGREHLSARQELEFDTEFHVLTMNVTRDAENSTAGSESSISCSISVQGYEGWWTKIGNRVTSVNHSDSGIDWTVIVGHAKQANNGHYTCVANMTNDSHDSGTMLVTVTPFAEYVEADAQNVYAKPLEPTALVCDFFGYRLSNFKWHKVSEHRKTLSSGVSNTSSLSTTHTRMMLYFGNVSKTDHGKYECHATNNRFIHINRYVQLKVIDYPSLQLNASVIGSKLVHLRWFCSKFKGKVTHLIRYSENGTLEWKDSFSVLIENGTKQHNGYLVKQLTRNTSYWFEIVLISEGKRMASAYSSWITPTGKDVLYSPNISVISKTKNSVIIEWPMPPEELRAHVKVYRIRVNSTLGGSEIVDIPNSTQTHWIIEKLQPSTSYDLEVKACFGDVSTDCYSSDALQGVFTKNEESGTQVGMWLPLTGTVFLLIVLGAGYFYKKARQRRIIKERLAYFYTENPISFNPELDISDQADLLPYEKKWEFPRKLLRLDEELGSGSFGIVWKARAKTIRRPEAISVVAVKTVRPTASLRCMKALLRELKILIYLGHHPNIVSLLGACTKNLDYGRLLVIVEFCRFGNLHDYLWRCRSKFVDELNADVEEIPDFHSDADSVDVKYHSASTLNSTSSAIRSENGISMMEVSCSNVDQPGGSKRVEDSTTGGNSKSPKIEPLSKYPGDFTNADLDPVRTQDLVSWAWQISRGMQYLASKKVLHGDLAARNVLLCEDNIVKICDFGLSKSLQENDDYKEEGNDPLPVKWMAIESLRDGIFSVKSDVWSFGVVLWELFSLAKTPYPEIRPENMCETLLGGYRMERPKYSPKNIYRTMLQCWEANPSKRPTFVELERSIGNLMEENVKVHYIELYTRCSRAYATIMEFRKTQAPENLVSTLPEPTNSTKISEDETNKERPFRMKLKQFFRRG